MISTDRIISASSWTCLRCETLNPSTNQHCEVCYMPRYYSITEVMEIQQLVIQHYRQMILSDTQQWEYLQFLKWWHELSTQWQELLCYLIKIQKTPDINDWKKIINIESLDLSEVPIQTLAPMRAFVNLKSLNCANTQIESLAPLRENKLLKSLDISSTPVKSLEPLRNLSKLAVLNCSNTAVSDLLPLFYLSSLQQLDISRSKVESLEPLRQLHQLQWLNCSETRISSLESLRNLSNLNTLIFHQTRITSLEPISELETLKEVVCWQTRISQRNLHLFRTEHPTCNIIDEATED